MPPRKRGRPKKNEVQDIPPIDNASDEEVDTVQMAAENKLKAMMREDLEDIIVDQGPNLKTPVTRSFVSALADLVYQYTESLGSDLETFSRHAKRGSVQPDDVLLCARRSDAFRNHLEEFIEKMVQERKQKAADKAKKKEREKVAEEGEPAEKRPEKRKKETVKQVEMEFSDDSDSE